IPSSIKTCHQPVEMGDLLLYVWVRISSCQGHRVMLPMSTSRCLDTGGCPMEGRVVGLSILPASPDDPHPCPGEDPDRMRMVAAAGPSLPPSRSADGSGGG